MASSCGGFPIRSDFDHHLKKLLVAVQTKREVNRSHDVTTGDLEDLHRTAALFRKVVPLLRMELDNLRVKLLGVEAAAAVGLQTNPFLDAEAGAPKRKKKVVTFATDQQTNPFLAGGRMEVETNPFVQPSVELSGAGATLPDRKLLEAGVTLQNQHNSVVKAVPVERFEISPEAVPRHSGAPTEAVSEQADAQKRKKKVVTLAMDQETNPFVTGGRMEVETNRLVQPTVELSEGGATLPDRKLLEAEVAFADRKLSGTGATFSDRKLLVAKAMLPHQKLPVAKATLLDCKPLEVSVTLLDRKLPGTGAMLPNQKLLEARETSSDRKLLKAGEFLTDQKQPEAGDRLLDRKLNQHTPAAAVNSAPGADSHHSETTTEAVSEQAGVPEWKKKAVTFAVNQQRPMVVQITPEVKVDQQVAVSSPTAGKTTPTMLRAANKFGRTRRRSRSRPSRPPQAKPVTTAVNQLIEKQVPLPLPPCYYCDGKHALCRCSWFKVLHLAERLDFVQRMKLCSNCFSQQHSTSNCRHEPRCWLCSEWHHTLLHRTIFIPKQTDVGSECAGMF